MQLEQCILGIDPALRTTGYGVIAIEPGRIRLADAGVIRSQANLPLELRLREIHLGVLEIIEQHRPECLAIEDLYSHYERPTTAILMGHARGVIFLAAANTRLPVYAYAATAVKKTLTGNGHAPKAQIQMAVKLQLGLKQDIEPSDVADALAIAITHHHSRVTNSLLGK